MSNTIQIKRSSTTAAVPTAGQLAQGELAVNLTDRKLYTKDASNAVVQLNPVTEGFRNRLINANPIINQRGYVSGTATTTANQYTLDRWRVVTSGQNVSWTDSGLTRTVTCPAGGLEQVIESLNIEGGTFVLNWIGTATATVNGTAVAKGGTFTLPANTNATVRFSSGTLSNPQLEAGSVATPFERRPYGTELALCQRYFQAASTAGQLAGTYWLGVSDAFHVPQIALPVVMRASPTMTVVGLGGSAFWTNPNTSTFSADSTAGWIGAATNSYLQLRNTRQAGGLTPSNGLTYFYQSGISYTASAEL